MFSNPLDLLPRIFSTIGPFINLDGSEITMSSHETLATSTNCLTSEFSICGLGYPLSSHSASSFPTGFMLILMRIFSPFLYPFLPLPACRLLYSNNFCHDSLSVFSPVTFLSVSEIILSVTTWLVLLSPHHVPVFPSQLVASKSCVHTTRPGKIPLASPIGLFLPSGGIKLEIKPGVAFFAIPYPTVATTASTAK